MGGPGRAPDAQQDRVSIVRLVFDKVNHLKDMQRVLNRSLATKARD
jgi:hypothetical protein